MYSQKIKRIKAFTLVELIIVITILAILATISFMSFQGYTRDARDSTRLSDITNTKKGLEIYSVQTGTLPKPDIINGTGTINGKILTYVGEFGENNSRLIKFNTAIIDPLTKTKYVYGVDSTLKQYQLATIMEGNPVSYKPFIETTYADINYAKVDGNYKGYIKYSSGVNNEETWIANIPSLIFNNIEPTVELLSNSTYYIVNKKTNLPYNEKGVRTNTGSIQKLDGKKMIEEVTKSPTSTLTGINISSIKESNFETIFTGAILQSFNLNGGDLSNSGVLLATVKTSVLGSSDVTNTKLPDNSCAPQPNYTGATYLTGTATQTNQPRQSLSNTGACYYTCGVGKVLDEGSCVSETCAGTTPDGIIKVQNALNFAGGTWNYNPTPGKCTYVCGTGNHTEDNSTCISNTKACTITNGVGSQSWTSSWGTCSVVSCNSGFYQSGNTCIAYVNGACSSLPTNAVYYNSTASYSLVNALNGTTQVATTAGYNASPTSNTCQYKCDSTSSWNGSSCIINDCSSAPIRHTQTQSCATYYDTVSLWNSKPVGFELCQDETSRGGTMIKYKKISNSSLVTTSSVNSYMQVFYKNSLGNWIDMTSSVIGIDTGYIQFYTNKNFGYTHMNHPCCHMGVIGVNGTEVIQEACTNGGNTFRWN